MKVEVAVLGSSSLTVRTVSVEVKQNLRIGQHRAQELCESRGGRPGLPALNYSPYGLCGLDVKHHVYLLYSVGVKQH